MSGYRIGISGSPSVAAVAATVEQFRNLANSVAGKDVALTVEARARCDTCGATSRPVDLSDPEAAEEILRADGWVRDTAGAVDTCPACARGGAR